MLLILLETLENELNDTSIRLASIVNKNININWPLELINTLCHVLSLYKPLLIEVNTMKKVINSFLALNNMQLIICS
jgi:hypothetical protein